MSNNLYDPRLEVQRLTRYIPFTKYVDFLCTGLFCPSISMFEDPWEGHVFPSLYGNAKSEDRQRLSLTINNAKKWVYASFWHAADHESYAMWRICGQLSEAVAIHTSLSRLKATMMAHCNRAGDPVALISPVEYVVPIDGQLPELELGRVHTISYQRTNDEDWNSWLRNMQVFFTLKPVAYDYEREVRLLVLDKNAPASSELIEAKETGGEPGTYLRIDDYNDFLTGVSIAPNAPKWFLTVLEKTNQRFEISEAIVPVQRSSILDDPGGLR